MRRDLGLLNLPEVSHTFTALQLGDRMSYTADIDELVEKNEILKFEQNENLKNFYGYLSSMISQETNKNLTIKDKVEIYYNKITALYCEASINALQYDMIKMTRRLKNATKKLKICLNKEELPFKPNKYLIENYFFHIYFMLDIHDPRREILNCFYNKKRKKWEMLGYVYDMKNILNIHIIPSFTTYALAYYTNTLKYLVHCLKLKILIAENFYNIKNFYNKMVIELFAKYGEYLE